MISLTISSCDPSTGRLFELCQRLSGPPKLVYFFLKASAKFSLESWSSLEANWLKIESKAIESFRTKIESTFRANLDRVARNLCLLHTIAVTLNQDFIEINSVSRHLVDLVEAGLLRIHGSPGKWMIYTPNLFLIQIFSKYVRWYTWERLEMLKSLIQSSSATRTQNGKVFEYLFALELCNSANCKLWKFLREKVGILPLDEWNPVIALMESGKLLFLTILLS